MKKIDYYKAAFSVFLKKEVPIKILQNYLDDTSSDSYLDLADFIGMNLKKEIEWSTSIAIVEAVDNMYDEAIANANIKKDEDYHTGYLQGLTDKEFELSDKKYTENDLIEAIKKAKKYFPPFGLKEGRQVRFTHSAEEIIKSLNENK